MSAPDASTLVRSRAPAGEPTRSGRRWMWLAWVAYAVALAVAPLVFPRGGAIAILSQMGSAIVFCLAYNMLLGQTGLLSFGHAVYHGLGAFVTVHALNLAAKGTIWLPLPLTPVVGALAGGTFAAAFGWVIARRAGTGFAMITFGIGELVVISASMFPAFFGGETGLLGSRVYGPVRLGLDFASALQAYYLIAFWVFVATAAMYAWTRTPLGRVANAVRDNAERAAFIGYDPQLVRYIVLVLSGVFSGVAGALTAINFESATIETLGAAQSGAVLLFTFIGGAGFFAGPIIGAVVGTLMTVLISTVTKAWPLYLGLFFVLVVKYAPGGIAGLAVDACAFMRRGGLRDHPAYLLGCMAAGLASAAGFSLLIEMIYRRTVDAGDGATLDIAGISLDTLSLGHWLGALVWTALATTACRASWRRASAERHA